MALKFKYRALLFALATTVLVGFIKSNAVNKVEAEEVETTEVSMDVYENTVKTIQLSIYDGDYKTYKSKLAKTIEVDARYSLCEKVQVLLNKMSESLYGSLPIEVTIENRSGKKVAVVNLVEPLSSDNKVFKELYENLDDKSGTWQNYFTSGEAKSIITFASLEATLKQDDYQGEWIDGYMIYHNGEALESHKGKSGTDVTWIYE